jgi:hypothetical protein
MLRRLTAALVAIAAVVVAGPPAHAYTHGCLSVAGFYTPIPPEIPDADYLGPLVQGDCYLRTFDGDTFTGTGPYDLACLDGTGHWVAGATDVPAAAVPLTCGSHTFVRVSTAAPGWVVAGSVQ